MTERSTHERELNLSTHRSSANVWDKPAWGGSREWLTMTRMMLGVAGVVLAVQGVRQRNVTGRMLAGLGGSLVWWALTGQGRLEDARRWFDHALQRTPWRSDDHVYEASADSFPASDPPAWTPTVGASTRRGETTH
jgi:hypothetical protein